MKTHVTCSMVFGMIALCCSLKELQAARVPLADSVAVGGTHIDTSDPPTGIAVRPDLGLVCVESLDGQLLYTSKTHLFEAHGTITPGGDYLVMFPDGGHYAGNTKKVNDMMAMRSSDRGKTWSQPKVAFDIDYNQHGFVPLIPRGSQRIYAFGTQPVWDRFSVKDGQQENAPIGYRWSDDDGHTWSKVKLIEPVNDPGFKGMSVMRMCETDAGTWLIGSHEGDWSIKPLMTRQYVLRSEDQGKTWTILPAPRHDGWYVKSRNRMDEGRPINLGRGEVFMMFRTATGNLWSARSLDDGKTWTDPKPTPLIHPDAPPMLFTLSDGKTLAAFHHNRFSDRKYTGLSARPEVMKDRSEIWVALSQDGGRTWSEPRFVFANALAETDRNAFFNYQCSYMDCFVDGKVLHLILPHRWKRVLHLTLPENALRRLPTKTEIQKHADAGR